MHRKRYLVHAGIVILVVALALALSFVVQQNDTMQLLILRYGYVGLLVASFISGFNVLVPVPIAAFMPVLISAGLDPVPMIAIMTIGVTIADCAASLVGNAFKELSQDKLQRRTVERLAALRKKHPLLPLVVLVGWAALVPLPNEVLVIPLAFLGYRIREIFLPVLFGNTLFHLLAYLTFAQIL